MADVEPMKKIVPFVTCEITFGQHVCELTFGIDGLIVGLRPFIIILITTSLSSKTLEPECFPLDGT